MLKLIWSTGNKVLNAFFLISSEVVPWWIDSSASKISSSANWIARFISWVEIIIVFWVVSTNFFNKENILNEWWISKWVVGSSRIIISVSWASDRAIKTRCNWPSLSSWKRLFFRWVTSVCSVAQKIFFKCSGRTLKMSQSAPLNIFECEKYIITSNNF